MSKIVHMQTEITATFGLLSDDGNRQDPQDPIVGTLAEFSEAAFVLAYKQMAAEYERRQAIFEAQNAEASPPAESANRAQRRAAARKSKAKPAAS